MPAMTIESGPAAGVIAAALAGKELGVPNLISFTVSDLARPFASEKFYKRRWGEGHGMRVIGQSPDTDDAAGMVRPRSVLDVLVHRSLRWAAAQGGAMDGSGRGRRHKATFSGSFRARFGRRLPLARLGDPGGDATHARLGRRSDSGFDRSWRRALFHRGRFSRLAGVALPEGYLAQLRAGRCQLPLRSYSAWRGVGSIVIVIATI
jgi:hypothetical protein